MDNSSCVVEFTGTAGSGKSYLKSLVEAKAESSGIAIEETKISVVDFSKKSTFSVIWNTLKLIFYIKPKSFTGALKSFYYFLRAQLLIKKTRERGGVLLLSEGFVHKVRLLRRSSRFRFMLKNLNAAFLNKFYFPDLVVVVQAKATDINNRLKKRDNVEKHKTDEGLKKSLELTLSDIEALPDVQLFKYNNSSKTPVEIKKVQQEEIISKVQEVIGEA